MILNEGLLNKQAFDIILNNVSDLIDNDDWYGAYYAIKERSGKWGITELIGHSSLFPEERYAQEFFEILDKHNVKYLNEMKAIPSWLYYGRQDLKKITIPEGVEAIEEFAFYGCHNLVEVNLPPTLKVINSAAFAECLSLKEIGIPSSVIKIDDGAFNDSWNLRDVYIYDNDSIELYSPFESSVRHKVTIHTNSQHVADVCNKLGYTIEMNTKDLAEAVSPRINNHQQHIESLVMFGEDGLNEINSYIDKFIDKIEGKENKLNITQKIDGAPAVLCGNSVEGYPKSFVGIKSVLNDPKNAYGTNEEIESKFGDRPELAEKLKYSLQLANSIPAGEVWQGDCLFTKGDLKEETIKGIDYITFQPNKIVYAFSEDNDGYNKIKNADFGIAFHTRYIKSGNGWSQSFNVDASKLEVPSNIYIMSPVLNVSNNKEDYNIEEINNTYNKLQSIESKLISNEAYNDLVNNTQFRNFWSIFENQNISDKKTTMLDMGSFFNDLEVFIKERLEREYNSKLAKLKTDAGKEKAKSNYDSSLTEILELLDSHKTILTDIVNAFNLVVKIKAELLNTFTKTKNDYSTFLRHRERGYEPTSGEGIAMSDMDGNIVKIVDRSVFSNANRDPNYLSGFQHESLEEDNNIYKYKGIIIKYRPEESFDKYYIESEKIGFPSFSEAVDYIDFNMDNESLKESTLNEKIVKNEDYSEQLEEISSFGVYDD